MKIIKEQLIDWGLRFLIVLSLAASAFAFYSQRSLANCTANWADQYTAIAQARSVANTDRIDALHKLLVDAINAGPNSENDPLIKADVERFLAVEKNYQDTIKTHPLPDPPSEVCH